MQASLAHRNWRGLGLALLASTMLCTTGATLAQQPAEGPASGADDQADSSRGQEVTTDIIITAQKREENLQDVPIAVTALGTEKLDELQVSDFDDYARYVPSISYQTSGPGFSNVYFRGVASGENANHSTSLPSVGTYLDEAPITTIQGALDIHVFDIARVEALAGPQGTLYGASSQAGTVRIITNKPDLSGFYGEANVELNSVAHGEMGYVGEAFVNAPLSSNVALRVVGWYDKDAGFIDNIPGTLVFPSLEAEQGTAAATFTNAGLVEDDYNDVETYGARAALKIDLDDTWTILPQLMAQQQKSQGFFAQERGLDELQVQQFNPERANDRWFQAALTVTGQIGNFDVTYAGAYHKRRIDGEQDYVDYAYFYDALSGYGAYFYDNNDLLVNPNQYIKYTDRYTKQSHELRFSSPPELPVRGIAGLFYQRHSHNIEQNYIVDNIADAITVPGTESNIWLTKQLRVDRDYAVFGEVTADVTDKLSLTLGTRIYHFNNSLVGFFGFAEGYSPDKPDPATGGFGRDGTGVAGCNGAPPVVDGSPCTNLDKRTKDTGFLHRLNATYKFTDDLMVYATASRGFRPGGINRRGTLPPYRSDFINNYELGFKTSWLDNRLRFNGALYQLNWNDVQLSFLGANGLTEIRNAADARIRGFELDLYARPISGLSLSAGLAHNDAKTTTDFCRFPNRAFDCSIPEPDSTTDEDLLPEDNFVVAPAGTRLPITAKWKGNALARYEFPIGTMEGHLQGALVYEGKRTSDIRPLENSIYGNLPSYTTVDVSAGLKLDRWSAELFVRNLFDKNGQVVRSIQCVEIVCGDPDGETLIGGKVYTYVVQPRTIGLKLGTKF